MSLYPLYITMSAIKSTTCITLFTFFHIICGTIRNLFKITPFINGQQRVTFHLFSPVIIEYLDIDEGVHWYQTPPSTSGSALFIAYHHRGHKIINSWFTVEEATTPNRANKIYSIHVTVTASTPLNRDNVHYTHVTSSAYNTYFLLLYLFSRDKGFNLLVCRSVAGRQYIYSPWVQCHQITQSFVLHSLFCIHYFSYNPIKMQGTHTEHYKYSNALLCIFLCV